MRAPDASLPAVLGQVRSASRLKQATEQGALEIEESIKAALMDLDDLELALPSKLGIESLAPELPATISLAPLADKLEPEASRHTYRVGKKLGVGGMATVYDAVKEGTDGFKKRVALKRIHDHLAEDKRIIELLVDEARLASMIDHPNVCQVLDFGVDATGHFMALEYLDGFTLRQIFEVIQEDRSIVTDPRHQLVVSRVIAGLAEGLHAAHELKDEAGESLEVVHRDVTPHNLFVLTSGNVKVADFGVARAKNQLHHTATGALKGKLAYSSPEQMHRLTLDRQTDIFALGTVMWEMLTGQRLFEAESESQTIIRICSEPAPDVRTRQPKVIASIAAIVRKAVAINPADRFKTAREMSKAIERALGVAGNSVPAADVSEWLIELMGSPNLPRRPRSVSDDSLAATASVVTEEIEADDLDVSASLKVEAELPVPHLTGSMVSVGLMPRHLVKKAPAKPITSIVVAEPVEDAAPMRREANAAVAAPAPRSSWLLPAVLGAAVLVLGAALVVPSLRQAPPPAAPVAATPAPETPKVAPGPVPAPVLAPAPVAATASAVADPVPAPRKATPAAVVPAPATKAVSAPRVAAEEKPTPAVPTLSQFGSVMVMVNGGSADVLVDGRNFGPAPQRVTLPVGQHTVAISVPGGSVSSAVPIKVDPGASSFITLTAGSH